MGGYNGGEIASNLATESIKNYIESNFNKIEHDEKNIKNLLQKAMEYANKIVYNRSKDEKELEQMGTTMEICLIYNNKIYVGHIGDSRIYMIRKDTIKKITTDHSYVEKLVRDGKITRKESYSHPKKNMLMKALGCNYFVEPDIMVKNMIQNDIIFICSDGLTNMISEREIYNIINEDIKKATNRLVQKANDLGGYDNISVIIIKNN